MTKKTFICPKFKISFTCNDDPVERIRRLRGALTRNKISIFEYLKQWNISHYQLRCAWCNDHNHDIQYIEHEVHNREIHPISVKRRFKAQFLCFAKNTCASKTLNKNSIEFIEKAYGMDPQKAHEHLHSRNKTPFYPCNHTNSESHKKSQSRSKEWWESTGKDRDSWISKANYSRSLEGYVTKHGTQGVGLWKEVQKLKSMTLDRLIDKHGEEEGKSLYNLWKMSITHDLPTYLRKYGKIQGTQQYLEKWITFKTDQGASEDTFDSFIGRVASLAEKNPLHVYNTFNIDNECKYYSWYNVAKEFYSISSQQIDWLVRSKLPAYKTHQREIFKNKYSYYSYSNCGTILKSRLEILVYDYLLTKGLHENQDFKINQKYPNTTLFYDLYLIKPNLYIEIAGNMGNLDYANHMRFKEQTFSSIIIYPHSYQQQLNQILGI